MDRGGFNYTNSSTRVELASQIQASSLEKTDKSQGSNIAEYKPSYDASHERKKWAFNELTRPKPEEKLAHKVEYLERANE